MGHREGFTDEQLIGSTQQMLSAGGSTRMARDPQAALRMSRNLDMTNSGSILGKLSGTLGDNKSSEQGAMKIFAESMKVGLDSSEFRAEQRKFSDTVATMVNRSGTRTEAGVGRIASSFGSFVEDKTMKGLDAASSAYDIQQGLSSTGGGIRGAIQSGALANSKIGKKMSFNQRMSFMNLSEDDINAGGAEIEAMAKDAKMSVEEFQNEAMKVKRESSTLRKSTDDIKKRYQAASAKGDKKEMQYQKGKYISAMSAEDKTFKGKTNIVKESLATAHLEDAKVVQQDPEDVMSANERAKKGANATGRIQDKEDAATAKSQDIARKEFNKAYEDLNKAALDAQTMTSATMEALMGLANSLKDDSGATKAVEEFAKHMRVLNEQMTKNPASQQQQPSASKKNGGK